MGGRVLQAPGRPALAPKPWPDPSPCPQVPPPGSLPAHRRCPPSTAARSRLHSSGPAGAPARRAAAYTPPTPLPIGLSQRCGPSAPCQRLLQVPLILRHHLSYRRAKVVSSCRGLGTARGWLRRETPTSVEGFPQGLPSRAVQGLLVLNPARMEAWEPPSNSQGTISFGRLSLSERPCC